MANIWKQLEPLTSNDNEVSERKFPLEGHFLSPFERQHIEALLIQHDVFAMHRFARYQHGIHRQTDC